MNLLKDYKGLLSEIKTLLAENRQKVLTVINHSIISTHWLIGNYIVIYEQNGADRATYGDALLDNLAKDLKNEFGKGFSVRNLRLFRQFYLTYPIWQSVIAESNETKQQSMIAELPALRMAIVKVSWTHLVRLMSIKNENERSFYMIETAENNWSVRELNRQIDSALFERLLINKNSETLDKISNKGQQLLEAEDLLKEPYVLEFLGLEVKNNFSESELETAIIDNLEKFLLELGKGFSFVARQFRISSADEHYHIDLVFYNRLLKCHVLIDLKIGKLRHQDIGQMQMYVNYFDREIKIKDEKPTIGIILCKEKNDFVVEYSLPENNQQIFPKEFLLYLPNKEELKQILSKYL